MHKPFRQDAWDKNHRRQNKLKISARNRLVGTVKNVEKGIITAKIKIEIATPATVTAIISKEATEELNIKTGDIVEAVIKATEVMVAKER